MAELVDEDDEPEQHDSWDDGVPEHTQLLGEKDFPAG
jgi:hypothetical protein